MRFDTQTPKKFTPTPNPPKILVIYRFRLLITAKQCFTSHKIINIYKFYKDSSCSHVFLKFCHFLSVLINVIVKPAPSETFNSSDMSESTQFISQIKNIKNV